MKKHPGRRSCKGLAALLLLAISTTLAAQHRQRLLFNADWQFFRDSAGSYTTIPAVQDGWHAVLLPHDWSIEGPFGEHHPATTGGGALPGGAGWYRKTFTLPQADSDKECYIAFDGVYCNSEVWINGHHLGKRPNGYISFHYRLTPFLHTNGEKNTIVVKADNSKQPNSRWYTGSGIYRNVWLITTRKVTVDQWGTFITIPVIQPQVATVQVATRLRNTTGNPQPATLLTLLYDQAGKEIARQVVNTTIGQDTATLVQQLQVPQPKLWSDTTPYLYKAVSRIVSGGVTDEYTTSFGIRSCSFDSEKGFFLNGHPLKIRGVCNHHDLGCLGAAINERAIERQLQLLKAMGCNGIRTSHNPPAPELLDLCDKMGFIIMDEAFDMWEKAKNPYDYHLAFREWHETDMRDFLLRDRNHPAVCIWSVGNEILEQWGKGAADSAGRVLARELVGIVKRLDPTREIVTANNEIRPINHLVQSGAFDLVGYNYSHPKWDSFLHDWPGKKLIITESTSALATRGHYDKVPADTIRRWPEAWDKPVKHGNADYTISAYDHVSTPWGSTHEESLRLLQRLPVVSGMFIWTGFDYLGEPTPYTWPARSSYFGIIDLAGFPKDVYYLYQSVWTQQPVLHLLPHWNWQQGDTIDVVAYYNCADEAELFLNNKSLGVQRKTDTLLHVTWRVPFVPGTLKVVSRKQGRTVLEKQVTTAGVPAMIRLVADRKQLKADGRDLSFVTVQVLDKAGNLVPRADNLVSFSVAGPAFIAGVDNGNPISHEPFKASYRKAMNGLCLAVLQSVGKAGTVTITATAEGLKPTTETVSFR